ncbi:hypothetical protein HHK36_025753 [Tetracentron sinense]|uniref:Uncharacterized protein n=1 Tax=Tetracentron sinense TaxID=13715 RepID=A0A835D3F3_TETSI|nr:hypothetical protein HHK36_025753 [Tetracentron sinense]
MGGASTSTPSEKKNNGADKMLATSMGQNLISVPPISSECCIHRVPEKLRRVNEAAYSPRVVSIGPFHRGKKRLQKMEEHKWRYLSAFLSLEHAKPLEDYVTALRELEQRARECYAETIKLNTDEFVKMMLLDGCFIIVFLLRYMCPKHRNRGGGRDPIFDTMWMLDALHIDMILFENQLPFFVLEVLDDPNTDPAGLIISKKKNARPSLFQLTTFYFSKLVKMDEILKNHFPSVSRSSPRVSNLSPKVSNSSPKVSNWNIFSKFKVGSYMLNYKRVVHSKLDANDSDMLNDEDLEGSYMPDDLGKNAVFFCSYMPHDEDLDGSYMPDDVGIKAVPIASYMPHDEDLDGSYMPDDVGKNTVPSGSYMPHDEDLNGSYMSDDVGKSGSYLRVDAPRKRDGKLGCYMPLSPSPPSIPPSSPITRPSRFQGKHFLGFLQKCYMPSSTRVGSNRYESTPSVTELDEAGVKFKVSSSDKRLLDVEFKNGVLEIPRLEITDFTESFFRNIIALEQCNQFPNPFITSYSVLMDSLINTPKDVSILCRSGIIGNCLGSDEEVSLLFNKLSKEVSFGNSKYYFSDLCGQLNGYCKISCNVWKASLKRDYFNTPWASISVGAAALLFLLTVIQTIWSVKS